jgi:glycosyltransferase involved in cell wall biosynthesis
MHVGLLIYGPLDSRSGGYRYDLELVERLRDAGDTVDVVSLPESSYRRRLSDNVSRSLRRRLLRSEFDVLLQDELCHPSLALVNRRLDVDYPLVALVHHLRTSERHHGWRTRTYELVERQYLQSVDAFVCNSETTRETVAAYTDPTPSVVAYPAGDRFGDPIAPARVRERAHEDPIRIVSVGSVTPRKNVETLVEGLSRISVPWKLTVVGDCSAAPRYVADVRRVVEATGTQAQVTFTGRVDDDAVAKHLERSHVFALPSSYEGFGIAYVEAMGFGLPVVASREGGATELVTHGHDGFLVDPTDPSEITDAVSALARNRPRLAEMGLAARARFTAHPTWDATAKTIRSFLTELCSSAE